jgi:hypothetical protein
MHLVSVGDIGDVNPSTDDLSEKIKPMRVGAANSSLDSGTMKSMGLGDANPTTDTASAFDFISKAWQAALSKLQTSSTDDGVELNQIFHATQAQIASNQETWDRCRRVVSAPSSDTMTFTRFGGFPKVSAVMRSAEHPSSLILQFEIPAEYSTKEFGFPDPLPKDLQNMLVFAVREDDVFPDYKRLLEASTLLLQHNLLIPFLVKLKAHLDHMQVYLARIEAWIVEP